MNFDPEKDYYGILGVTASAEMAVIKAAYKALAGIYHPDRNPTPNAKEKMQAINEAWSVLSNPDIRKKYDEALSQREPDGNFYTEDDQEDTIRSYFEKDWAFAVSYYPNLELFADRLGRISRRLGVAYKAVLVSEKRFKDAEKIAKKMEKEFLERYFGPNHRIQAIVSELIFGLNDKALLKELNSAISILGTKDPGPIIQKFQQEISRRYEQRAEASARARSENREKNDNSTRPESDRWAQRRKDAERDDESHSRDELGLTAGQSIGVMILLVSIFLMISIMK